MLSPGDSLPFLDSLPSFIQAAAAHFYELEKSQGSPISSSCPPRGSAYGTEEEEVTEGRGPWVADTQSAANFHPPGAGQKELPESGSWAMRGNTLPLPPRF